jgi:hypothetical protein
MADQIPVVGGSFGYTAPSFTYGQTSQAINGGYTFDLPLATVQAFTNNALKFSANNTQNAQGFFGGIFTQAQAGVSQASRSAFEYQDKGLAWMTAAQKEALRVQQYAIKKKYGSGCFITTAVCKQQRLPDDCWQLMALRKFRDDHLMKSQKGKRLVKQYYEKAPGIVEAIDALPNAASIYAYLSAHYIDRALQQISVGDLKGATNTYTAMVHKAEEFAQGV